MKNYLKLSPPAGGWRAGLVSHPRLVALLVVLLAIGWNPGGGRAQTAEDDAPGAQVLTRGPVHEAFAGIVAFNPEPGIVISRPPPEAIEEAPPDERPAGDNVAWIPGYWAWDDERNDFLWISGVWRALPPGRAWVAGYWGQTAQGYQWTSGYWADAAAREITYLPAPPATLEVGPNIVAPSPDYGWTPGCWVWQHGRYAWRPGYWVMGRSDWDWIPSHYVWTPRGYILAGGFWDYPVARRGLLFAPVYFEAGIYARRGFHFSPRIVIDLGVFSDHLFLRPRFNHYYFGDYYAVGYRQGGFHASFTFQANRYGYDPIFSHQRWEHRQDRGWENRLRNSYDHRRDHEDARPPRTWAAQRSFNSRPGDGRQEHVVMAASINQMARRKDPPVRLQTVARDEREKFTGRGQELQKSRDQRQKLEARPVNQAEASGAPVGRVEPARVQRPAAPIADRPAKALDRSQAPPAMQRTPKPEVRALPAPETSRRPVITDRPAPQAQPRQPAPGPKSPAPGRGQPDRQEKPDRREKPDRPEKERRSD